MLSDLIKVAIWFLAMFAMFHLGVIEGTRHADPHACVSVCAKHCGNN